MAFAGNIDAGLKEHIDKFRAPSNSDTCSTVQANNLTFVPTLKLLNRPRAIGVKDGGEINTVEE
jgi:hypothetical protein